MPEPLAPSTLGRLERVARGMAASAYAPYSCFHVGAAVLARSGRIYGGCNVENASFGLTNCAERSAVFAAAAAGEREIRAVLIYTPTAEPTAPCGACRQVINEFGPDAIIVGVCAGKSRLQTTLGELLPGAFGLGSLAPTRQRSKRNAV